MKSLAVIGAICFPLIASASANIQGKVIGVADGDTITVLDSSNQQHKVRLSGIDAPEKKQPFGQRSKEHLSQLVYGKPANIEWTKRDRYKRILGKVLVADPSCVISTCPKNFNAGLSQISVGLAWWYRKYGKEQSEKDRQRYELAESQANAKKAGLWADEESIPPWEWRSRENGRCPWKC